jgi:predicted branched-subunit amino acid permease
MSENAPALIVLATSLAINLRMAMYSVALVPYLGHAPLWMRGLIAYFLVDQTYAISALTYERRPAMTLSERIGYFFGTVTPVCPFWYVATWVGAEIGGAIPPGYAIDFAVPITFLALIAPLLRTPAHVTAATVSVLVTLLLGWLPYGIGLLVAAPVAMVAGAQVEQRLARRAAQ